MDKKTPLYQIHLDLGGKVVPFAGYLLPIQYEKGIIAEHMAVRTNAGIFDVSHMAELILEGSDALKNLNMLLPADLSMMEDGAIKYSPMCNEKGGIVDDLLVYRLGENKYLLVVNAANHEKDALWISQHLSGDVSFEDVSEDLAQIALQGPNAFKILQKICDIQYIPQKYYTFVEKGIIKTSEGNITSIISRTGYTGEDGFELYCKSEDAVSLWNSLLAAGEIDGLIPCGLGARDTLRLEAGMPLYGHEMNDDISPLEASLGMFCKMDKGDFIGKKAILDRGLPQIKRVGLKVTGRGIAREGCKLFSKEGVEIGWVSSGTHCPFLNQAVAMGYIEISQFELGKKMDVDVRGRLVEAEIIKLPFYKRFCYKNS